MNTSNTTAKPESPLPRRGGYGHRCKSLTITINITIKKSHDNIKHYREA